MVKIEDYDKLMDVVGCGKCLVKVSAAWCGPCSLVKKNIESIEGEYDDVTFIDIDVDKCDERILDHFGVRGVPFIMTISDGNVVGMEAGMQTVEQLRDMLSALNQESKSNQK